MVSELERRALRFAENAHSCQKRKYDGQPYIVHPISVAETVKSVAHTPEMVAAAYLHDVVEDTLATLSDIDRLFGAEVALLVAWLTDVSTPFHGNRAARKELDRQHIALAPAQAKTIKLADLIDNSVSIKSGDPDFWHVYRNEKMLLLSVLDDGDKALLARAREML